MLKHKTDRLPAPSGEFIISLMRVILLFALLSALGMAGCQNHESSGPATIRSSVTNYEGRGVVVRLEPDGRNLVIRHEEITNYMGAMTMPFLVRDTSLLAGIQPGNLVGFRLNISASEGWIDRLRILQTNAPQPNRPTLRAVREVNPLAEGDFLPEYNFTNELGRAINLQDYRGGVTAFTFFFTSCPYPMFCPKMCANFQAAQDLLLHDPDAPKQWHLCTISFDPETDSPIVLQSYARRYNYDASHWSFLTGLLIDITAIGEQFGLNFWRESGSISHNLRTVVLDPQGRVFKIFPSNEWTPQMLADAMKQAVKAKP